jgi:tetratricopeptide (TPR) repeat protein
LREHRYLRRGKVQRAAEQPADALISYQRAATIQRRLGDRSREAFAIEGTGQAYEQMGRVAEATDFYRVAADTYRELDDRWSLARCLHHLANALDQQGSREQARSCWEQALPLLADFDDPEASALRERITRALSSR